ncbi:MAG TPA: TIGR03084 family metal-binding protein [Mycobacteriales bacterium]|nr:TIGR03084 family metal-binding protein [Mycobacteriales bacterium]
MASRHEQVVADLRDESSSLLALIAPLTSADWARATPAAGWSVQDQVNHLAWFDESAALAVTDPAEFNAGMAGLTGDFPDVLVSRQRGMPHAATLDWFRAARSAFLSVAAAHDGGLRLPWYGTTMSLTSSVTARLMETWAHGQDIADALGVTREPTARLRHVCHLGVATRGHSFRLRGLPVPPEDVHVALSAPDGALWTWGSDADGQSVRGSALDFCLLVTQRRHLADTTLTTTGAVAAAWLTLAQSYAGLPGPGRTPR